MNKILRLVRHIFAIVIGYFAAVAAASALLYGFLLIIFWDIYGTISKSFEDVLGTFFLICFGVNYYAWIPAAIAILIGEAFSVRSWRFHALGGVLVALALFGYTALRASALVFAWLDLGILAASVAGGLGYWAVAGRSAGLWRRPSDATANIPPGY